MSIFGSFPTESVDLVKESGEVIKGIEAHVQSKKIFPKGIDVVFDVGDIFRRILPNGGIEEFEITNPKFYQAMGGIEAHYQIEVRRAGVKNAEYGNKNTYINVNGNDNNIVNDSIGSSIDNRNNDVRTHLDELVREVHSLKLPENEEQENLEIIAAVKKEMESEKPNNIVIKTLLSALPAIAEIVKISGMIIQTIN